MGIRLDAGYLDSLRELGLTPKPLAGWLTRGRDMTRILGTLDHHTAGARTGYWPSGRVLLEGRPDLPGPLCQPSTPRAAPGDMTVYVVAAGKANHAGTGRLPVDPSADSNYELIGLERELVGDGSDITPHRTDVACRVHAATLRWAGITDPRRTVRHATYATPTGRKIDTAGVTDSHLQGRIGILLAEPTITAQEIDAMETTFVRECHELYLGAPTRLAEYSLEQRRSFDYWLHMILTGQVSREKARAEFQAAARTYGRL